MLRSRPGPRARSERLRPGLSGAPAGEGGDGDMWEPREACGGHYGAVVDACWAAGGAALLTVGADQTARLAARCAGRWCELARPQARARAGPAGAACGCLRPCRAGLLPTGWVRGLRGLGERPSARKVNNGDQ